jgi:hypothetical protein
VRDGKNREEGEREEKGREMPVEARAENRELCLCPHCPTYNECMTIEEEALFCGTSITMCEDVEQQGCVCGRCTVHKEYNLLDTYYCLGGPAG